jgi:enamine deaminase RidA (YjgF/YER057c/UK114 family)
MSERRRVGSGSPYEARFGFCRALRTGDRVLVAGTAPIWPDGSCDPDAGVQARRCYEIILEALAELGAEPRHVVRTRVYITDAAHTEAVGNAHGEVFAEWPPVNTMVVVAGLVDERWKVEIEAEAVLD